MRPLYLADRLEEPAEGNTRCYSNLDQPNLWGSQKYHGDPSHPWFRYGLLQGRMVVKLSLWLFKHKFLTLRGNPVNTLCTEYNTVSFYSNTGRNNDLQSWVKIIS